jgi:hypothetical protein
MGGGGVEDGVGSERGGDEGEIAWLFANESARLAMLKHVTGSIYTNLQ